MKRQLVYVEDIISELVSCPAAVFTKQEVKQLVIGTAAKYGIDSLSLLISTNSDRWDDCDVLD